MRVNVLIIGVLLSSVLVCKTALSSEPMTHVPNLATLLQQSDGKAHSEALALLLNYWTLYNQQADYLYRLAWHTQQLGQLEQALDWYERAVMFNPQHGGAWYQMAHLCHALNQPLCLNTSADFILHQLNPPAEVTQSLNQLLQQPYPQSMSLPQAKASSSGFIKYHHGYASNPSYSSQSNSFPIYLNTWVPVTIEGARIGGSPFNEVSFAQEWQLPAKAGSAYFSGNYRQFSSAQVSPAWHLLGVYKPAPKQWYGYLSLAHYESSVSGGLTVLEANQIIWGNRRLSIEAGLGMNRFEDSLFDGQSWRLGAQALIWQAPKFRWLTQLLYEIDHPNNNQRPGGSAYRMQLGNALSYQHQRINLEYKLLWQYQKDEDKYSAFIPLTRSNDYWYHEIKAGYDISASTEVSVSYLTQSQASNYVLFAWQDQQTKLGITWRY